MSHILQNFTLLQLKQKGGSYICWQQKLEALLIFFHCQVTKNWRFNSELLPKSEPSRPYILCLGAKNFLLPPPELLLSLGEHLPIIYKGYYSTKSYTTTNYPPPPSNSLLAASKKCLSEGILHFPFGIWIWLHLVVYPSFLQILNKIQKKSSTKLNKSTELVQREVVWVRPEF